MKPVVVLFFVWCILDQVSLELTRSRCKREGEFREPYTGKISIHLE